MLYNTRQRGIESAMPPAKHHKFLFGPSRSTIKITTPKGVVIFMVTVRN